LVAAAETDCNGAVTIWRRAAGEPEAPVARSFQEPTIMPREHRNSTKHLELMKPGRVSTVAKSIQEIPENSRAFLIVRESACTQENNVIDQELHLRRVCKRQGVEIVGCFSHVESGWRLNIHEAVETAKRLGAVIVAETIDRIMRPEDYHSVENWNAKLTVEDLLRLAKKLDGVPLFTVADPDASPGENRSMQTKRGQRYKSKGGRPFVHKPKKRFREKWMPLVARLHAKGKSHAQIARVVSRKAGAHVGRLTIRGWIINHLPGRLNFSTN
jgi:hypothetical protein